MLDVLLDDDSELDSLVLLVEEELDDVSEVLDEDDDCEDDCVDELDVTPATVEEDELEDDWLDPLDSSSYHNTLRRSADSPIVG